MGISIQKKAQLDNNKKSLIKNTILGLVLGGSAASAYSLMNNDDKENVDKTVSDRIIVPLSRKHFMKAVRRPVSENKKTENTSVKKTDVSKFTPQELAAFKRAILRGGNSLRKAAELPQKITSTTSPETKSTKVCTKKGNLSLQSRDKIGRYTKGTILDGSEKKAQIPFLPAWDNIKGQVYDTAGLASGLFIGTAGAKLLFDRIRLNRKKKEVENARRMYANLVNKEVNDDDMAYYKEGQATHRSPFETISGNVLSMGVGMAALSSLVVYRIMENRRKSLERDADKDNSKFPKEKSVEFKFV